MRQTRSKGVALVSSTAIPTGRGIAGEGYWILLTNVAEGGNVYGREG